MEAKKLIMKKVITYGTYDLLHYGHIRLLERAKALGDYLIVGVTSDSFDKIRGKINVQQSLMERVEAVRATGIADEIIIEEYEGQKIDDIKRLGIDIFAIGSDWKGYFDYLNAYCKVVYLERTEGISSSELREKERKVRLGFVGENANKILSKYYKESLIVNGADVIGVYNKGKPIPELSDEKINTFNSYDELLNACDAVYIITDPKEHYIDVKTALQYGKHVLCESPIALSVTEYDDLSKLANDNNLILMSAIKTAYSTAYNRLLVIVKSGRIGKVVSVDATCTSLIGDKLEDPKQISGWNSICSWGPTALLPVFQTLGTKYNKIAIDSMYLNQQKQFDKFTRISFTYPDAVASVKIGVGVKSEGELIISGTKGYIYVPAPWWKTDYFEIRYENQTENKRYFYQLDGEGIRYVIAAFIKSISSPVGKYSYIENEVLREISKIFEEFYDNKVNILM